MPNQAPIGDRPVTVQVLVSAKERLGVVLECGHQGLGRAIKNREPVKPGLVLAGLQPAHTDAVHVMGRAEYEYLSVRSPGEQRKILMDYVRSGIPCVVTCWGLRPLPVLLELAAENEVPIFSTTKSTGAFIRELQAVLILEMAPKEQHHGVLVQVHDLGILLTGMSGIGKSETALELVLRGHRMVADDVVEFGRTGDSLIGMGLPSLGQFVEIRGLGILHAGDLFGQAAVVDSVRLDLIVQLVEWETSIELDRTGLDTKFLMILGVEVPHLVLPVRPGRNIAMIVEIAARNQILRKRGVNSAQRYEAALLAKLQSSNCE